MGFRLWEPPQEEDRADDDDAARAGNGENAEAEAAAEADTRTEGGRPKRKVKGDGGIVLVREFPGAAGKAGDAD
ncbi:hypothetical protein G7Z17_g10735 [Cylindrodendrum hubeiense]|uniref:Uncharacterized protein n=1 Tax=Cylindrodendrum hubeiense TaxID=595255 RepID=A0A9P5H5D9_9HYPO|nr:hypothetical protein G7Z17_g10735 [Cylindrodendrum hubeiense]